MQHNHNTTSVSHLKNSKAYQMKNKNKRMPCKLNKIINSIVTMILKKQII